MFSVSIPHPADRSANLTIVENNGILCDESDGREMEAPDLELAIDHLEGVGDSKSANTIRDFVGKKREVKNHCFLIEAEGQKEPACFIVKKCTFDEAVQKVHEKLREKNPERWSEDWRDLKTGIVEYGIQTCYSINDLFLM